MGYGNILTTYPWEFGSIFCMSCIFGRHNLNNTKCVVFLWVINRLWSLYWINDSSFDCFSNRTENIWLKSFWVVHQRFPREQRRYVYTNIPCEIAQLLTKHEQIMAECWDRLKSLTPPERCIYSQHELRTLTLFSTSNALCLNCCVDYVKIWATVAHGRVASMYGRPVSAVCTWHSEVRVDWVDC